MDHPDGETVKRRRTSNRASVTIRDVARHAGVSVATVSRALRGSDLVHPATRERVDAAIEALRFTPSQLGRSLAERRHAANGIVFPDLSGPFYAEVVLGYEEVAARLGRSVLILSTHNRESADEMVLDLAGRVDGLAVFGRTVHDVVVAEIVERGVPVVLMARTEVRGADSVRTENVSAAQSVVEHLVTHGHRRMAFLGDPVDSTDVAERWAGFRAAVDRAGLPAPDQPVTAGFKEDDGARAAVDLRAGGLPDVVVCANDELALGLMEALEDHGVRVPDDVAVTGWDDVMAARYAGLTTVRQPMRDMGARAARMLDARISGDSSEPRHDVLTTQLVVRRSCGLHPKEAHR
ncbi:LacI family DNA-binding transcriptional regulator [Jiangella asiatica]|uniref:LacI family transcriptional regulator n=1 Tax=Jiangella asiatica TaxID=2530372 RepID=A0A4V6PFF0_9ACTN|nr:LacI family DNA-binding transcriptional regulator [Jiangella asiatica]TDE02008.1 LacI family transcriptional regulator [Jiangella asiatica]